VPTANLFHSRPSFDIAHAVDCAIASVIPNALDSIFAASEIL
jgi:hypothetical protein